MNFLQRRAILKKANYLALTPVRLASHEVGANDRVVVLFPRFTSKFAQKHIIPKLKSPYIKIKLDEIASAVWKVLDGKKTVGEVAKELASGINSEKNQNSQDVEGRLTAFLTLLYEQKIITFKEVQ